MLSYQQCSLVHAVEPSKTTSSTAGADKSLLKSSSHFSEQRSSASSASASSTPAIAADAAHRPKSKWELMDQQESIFPPDEEQPSVTARSDSPPRFVCSRITSITCLNRCSTWSLRSELAYYWLVLCRKQGRLSPPQPSSRATPKTSAALASSQQQADESDGKLPAAFSSGRGSADARRAGEDFLASLDSESRRSILREIEVCLLIRVIVC